jgi:hypothetical protein
LEWIEKKLVPVSRAAVYKCLAKANNAQPASENWNMRGQRALLTDDEIDEVGNSLRILRGSSLTRKDAETAFIKSTRIKCDCRG